jgi:hypothetical protein
MKLVKETLVEELNENHFEASSDESSMASNQLKNIMKNAQAMLDLLSTGQQLDAWVQSKIAVSDDKIQEVKNYLENEATEEIPQEPIEPPVDDFPPEDAALPAPEPEVLEPSPAEEPADGALLPSPFPEDEVETDAEFSVDPEKGKGDVSVIDIETRYEDEVEDED